MSYPATEDRVYAVICQTFRLPEETPRDNLRMSNPPAWDSLGHMQLVAALEQEFQVRFPTYVLAELTSLTAIVSQVDQLS